MTKDKALTISLDFIERVNKDGWILADFEPEMYAAITAIKEALTQPEQPKVRTGNCLRVGVCASEGHKIAPQRPWVGLTDEEKHEIRYSHMTSAEFIEFIEKTLRDKNT